MQIVSCVSAVTCQSMVNICHGLLAQIVSIADKFYTIYDSSVST